MFSFFNNVPNGKLHLSCYVLAYLNWCNNALFSKNPARYYYRCIHSFTVASFIKLIYNFQSYLCMKKLKTWHF